MDVQYLHMTHAKSFQTAPQRALHAIGAVPNAPWAECTDDVLWPAPIRDRLLTRPHQIVEGIIQIPQSPGWGVELDWEYVEAHARVDERIEG